MLISVVPTLAEAAFHFTNELAPFLRRFGRSRGGRLVHRKISRLGLGSEGVTLRALRVLSWMADWRVLKDGG